jgi:hypothetical protein
MKCIHRLPKKILNVTLDEKRKTDKLKTGWFDNVQTGIRTLEIKSWIHKAPARKQWARITREATVKLKGM